ncbi:hypothetical protein [Acuticoccus sediminis]|uniref:hypothetical protein n=1 Tax=Acuticoccus sediminis TaxID=2184697 RepID=UPI001CFF08FE|nr:hypothetical protein [Acuticoccus sediminis]
MDRRRQFARTNALLFRRNYVYERRILLGLSAQTLAERAKVDEEHLLEFELHHNPHALGIASVARVAEALECPYLLLWVPPGDFGEVSVTLH